MNNSSELLDHENFLIFGAARSGLAAARLLVSLGKHVAIYDEAPAEKLDEARRQAEEMDVPLFNDIIEAGFPNGWQVLVLSPGIPTTHSLVILAEECGCVVRSEIEIAYLASKAPLVAITGTNGKTTVTHLVAHILRHAGRPVAMGGNVGYPLSDAVSEPAGQTPEGVVVAEVSSFQLETIERFRPRVACVLNITPDHLDRYGAMTNYTEAKYRVTENQTRDDMLVLNGDDSNCLSFLPRTHAEGWQFSLRHPLRQGAFLQEDRLCLCYGDPDSVTVVMERNEVPLPGLHNTANVLAALAIGAALDIDVAKMAEAVRNFKAVPHRIEFVAEIQGARYYNDSKATNLDSTEKALASFRDSEGHARVILIAGGRDKGARWESLKDLVAETVKVLIPIGEAGPTTRQAWGGVVPQVCDAADMADAVKIAHEMALPGDTVLLSPGCASFDMYRNFEKRGDHFRSLAQALGNHTVNA